MTKATSTEPDICGKCGGELDSNPQRTRFKCKFCGAAFNLPEAPILARSLRPFPSPPPVERPPIAVKRQPPAPSRPAPRPEPQPAPRPRQRASGGGLGGWAAILVECLMRFVFFLTRAVVGLVGMSVVALGIGGAIFSMKNRTEDLGPWWNADYGLYASIGVAVFGGLILICLPRR